MIDKKLSDLEKRVLLAIGYGRNTFTAIDTTARKPGDGSFRATDRAIQKLRKKGYIKWDGKVWALDVVGKVRRCLSTNLGVQCAKAYGHRGQHAVTLSTEPPCRKCGGKEQYILAGDAVDCECVVPV